MYVFDFAEFKKPEQYVKILPDFEHMTLKMIDLKNNRRTSAHFWKLVFLIL